VTVAADDCLSIAAYAAQLLNGEPLADHSVHNLCGPRLLAAGATAAIAKMIQPARLPYDAILR
jgi:hypothetical protein